MSAGAPALGGDEGDDSYHAFAARWDNPEEGEPALFAVTGPVRLGSLDQRRELLQRRP